MLEGSVEGLVLTKQQPAGLKNESTMEVPKTAGPRMAT